MIRGVTKWDKSLQGELDRSYCRSDQDEYIEMVWSCDEKRNDCVINVTIGIIMTEKRPRGRISKER